MVPTIADSGFRGHRGRLRDGRANAYAFSESPAGTHPDICPSSNACPRPNANRHSRDPETCSDGHCGSTATCYLLCRINI